MLENLPMRVKIYTGWRDRANYDAMAVQCDGERYEIKCERTTKKIQ